MLQIQATTIDTLSDAENATTPTYISYPLGPLTVSTVAFPVYASVRAEDVGSSYWIQLPTAGQHESRHRDVTLMATPGTAAVYQPHGGTFRGRFGVGYRGVCVRLDAGPVGAAFERLVDRPLRQRLSLQHAMDVSTGRGRTWAAFMLSVCRQLAMPDSLLTEPMVAAPLTESLLHGFVLATSHSYSGLLTQSALSVGPRCVRTALDLIEADPKAPWTVTLLAEQCQVAVRTLQLAFRRHLDTTPMEYVRKVRFRRAHEELLAADPDIVTVAAVARRWGFGHPGRFATSYRRIYGRTPFDALHGQQGAFGGQHLGANA
ncbi:AraC family transcriptional regulator [Streptomyces sp. NPDC057062]|uniref:AraC family transcriptional regulator n=1 Tax=Streptomyces sp. NPDC057062 TaxID=3346011 RepID=UPI003635D725